jgi:hypothetical protein
MKSVSVKLLTYKDCTSPIERTHTIEQHPRPFGIFCRNTCGFKAHVY